MASTVIIFFTDMSVAEQSQSVVMFLHSPTCGYSKKAVIILIFAGFDLEHPSVLRCSGVLKTIAIMPELR